MTVILAQRASDGIEVLTPAQILSSLTAAGSVGNNMEESNDRNDDGRCLNTHHLQFRPVPPKSISSTTHEGDSMVEKSRIHNDTDESSNSSSSDNGEFRRGRDGGRGGRSTTTRIHSGNDNDNDDRASVSIETNTRRVLINRIIRVLLITILIILCVAIPGLVYMYLQQEEIQSFKNSIENFSREIFESIQQNIPFQFMVLGDLAREITTTTTTTTAAAGYGKKNGTTTYHHQEWPFVTIPNFEVSASRAMSRMETSSIVFTPYVANDTMKSKWEEYSIQHTSEWMPQSIDQSIENHIFCCDNNNTTRPTSSYVNDIDSMNYSSVRPYFPIWQHLPISYRQVNLDLLSHEAFQDSIVELVVSSSSSSSNAKPLIGKSFLGTTADYISSAVPFASSNTIDGNNNKADDIVGTLIYPVFDQVEDNDDDSSVLVGALLSTLPWRRFLGNFNIDYVDSILVMENTCGQRFAYQVNEGRIESVEDPDFDDATNHYHDYEEMFDFLSISIEFTNDATLNDDFCTYSLRIFPSNELYQQYITKNPVIVAAITSGVFAILLILFLSYDIILRKRIAQVTDEAVESREIITNLFPSFVREMKDNERLSDIHRKQQAGVATSNTCFRKSLPDCAGQNGFPSSTATTPMAEKFENVTVMFAGKLLV